MPESEKPEVQVNGGTPFEQAVCKAALLAAIEAEDHARRKGLPRPAGDIHLNLEGKGVVAFFNRLVARIEIMHYASDWTRDQTMS